MGQSVKAVLQLVMIVLVIGALGTWNDAKPDPFVRFFRYGGPPLAIVIAFLLWRNGRRKETLPDVLARECGSYFERDGFCFGFTTSVSNGVCWRTSTSRTATSDPAGAGSCSNRRSNRSASSGSHCKRSTSTLTVTVAPAPYGASLGPSSLSCRARTSRATSRATSVIRMGVGNSSGGERACASARPAARDARQRPPQASSWWAWSASQVRRKAISVCRPVSSM